MKLRQLFLALVSVFLLAACTPPVQQHAETSFLPLNAALVLRINQPDRVQALADSTSLSALQALPVRELNAMSGKTWTGALVSSGADKMDWIWTTERSDSSFSAKLIEGEIQGIQEGFSAVRYGSAVAISQNAGLLQDALNQVRSGFNIIQVPGFDKLWNNASSSDALNLFVQHEELEGVGSLFYKQDWSWLQHMASWSEIDLAVRKDGILLTSVALSPDSSATFMSTFNTSPSGNDVSEVVAASASYAVKMDVGDPVAWMREYNSYRGKKQRLKRALQLLKDADLEAVPTANWFTGQFVRVGYGDGHVVAAKLQDKEAVTAMLSRLSTDERLYQGSTTGTMKADYRFTMSSLFGWWYTGLGTPSWMVYEDWLLLAEDGKMLEVYRGELATKATWERIGSLEAYADALDKKSHFSVAFKVGTGDAAAYTGWSEDELPRWSESLIAGSMEVKGDLAFGSARSISPKKEETVVSTYLWSASLDAPALAGPWMVKNHRTGANNVIVQDENFKLYWLNEKGAVQWTKDLGEAIAGEVTQVDLFKNNKFQLLFATTNALQCVDLLGRNVDGYPVRLEGQTSLGATVMDYDKNRNYRFLVPVGAALYNYTSDGQLVKGWNTKVAPSELIQSPLLFQKGGKDYIITSTATQAYVLNRRGESRIKTAALPESNQPWTVVNGSIPAIKRIGLEGETHMQSWDGSVAVVEEGLSGAQGMVQASYGTVVWSDQAAEVRSSEGSKAFSQEAIMDLEAYPGGTGVLTLEGGIVVVNLKSGETYGSFLGSAAKAGRLTASGPPVLILANGNSVVCYQL